MATPLTDAINALTAYANETTGASDTTLSDAVESLVAGYGGGGGGITFQTGTFEIIDPTHPTYETWQVNITNADYEISVDLGEAATAIYAFCETPILAPTAKNYYTILFGAAYINGEAAGIEHKAEAVSLNDSAAKFVRYDSTSKKIIFHLEQWRTFVTGTYRWIAF